MASREEFLSLLKTLPDKSFINYYLTENIGFSITFKDYYDLAEKLHEYWSRTVKGGFEYVGIYLTDYLWLPCLLLVIWKSGKACACVGTQYSQECNLNFLNTLNVEYLISDKKYFSPDAELLKTFKINVQEFYILKRNQIQPIHKVNADICYGIMTSGSTGMPKIIQVPWSCILVNVYELISLLSINKSDNIYLSSPYTFDPFFIELFIPFITGCSLTIVSLELKMLTEVLLNIFFKCKKFFREETMLSPMDNMFYCKTGGINNSTVTFIQMTPSIFKRWGVNNIKNVILCDNSPLRILLLGGEKLHRHILDLKSKSNGTKIYNIYGITEISCWAFIKDLTDCPDKISIGMPLGDITYKIDDKNELHLGSRKRKCIIDSENVVDDGILFRNTGDLVEIIDNEIYVVCRSNQIVKKFGIKINLERVEKFFSVSNEIEECYCIFDEDGMKVAIFYENNSLSEEHCLVTKEYSFKQGMSSVEVPDYIIEIKNIPLSSNGKCDRQSLLQTFRKIRYSHDRGKEVEVVFREIWNCFSKDRNFLDNGGDSVKVLLLITRLEEAGVEVPKTLLPTLLKNGDYDACVKCLIDDTSIVEPKKKSRKLDNEDLYSFRILWIFDMKKCVDASPTVFECDGAIHVVVGSHSSRLSSVKIDTGQENWTINLGDRIESGFCVNKSSTFGVIGCYDHHVYSISVLDGLILWKYKTDGMIKSTPCFSTDEKSVYVASYDTHLYRLNSHNGSLIVKIKLGERGVFCSGATYHKLNTFYIANLDGVCVCLSQESNEIIWKRQLESPVFASPVFIDNCVAFAEVMGCIHCFSCDKGDKMWCYESNGYIYSTPCHNSGHLVFGCYDNHLYCLELAEKPMLKWKCQLDSPVFGKPCLYGDELVAVATTKGWLYIHHLERGTAVGQIKLSGEIFSSPKISVDNLVVGCRDDNLYCLNITKTT